MGPFGRANLGEACSGLLGAKQRSILALVGIVIGVASVSTMISIGSVVRSEGVRQFQELGTDIVNVRLRARDQGGRPVSVGLDDVQGVATLPGIVSVAPYIVGAAPIILAGTSVARGQVIGATDMLAGLSRLTLVEGRFVSRLDGRQYFCTVGAEIADALHPIGSGDVVGAKLRIHDTVFTVVGALERTAQGQRPFDPNEAVFIPIEAAWRATPGAVLRDFQARVGSDSHYLEATREMTGWFRDRVPEARVRVRSPEELIEQMNRQKRLYTLLLGAVGGISLLVGGIGVMNVMLAAVSERKAEIGIRRAIGARRRDIEAQFLTEAMMLSMIGGVVGVVLGIASTYAICRFTGWLFEISLGGTLLGAAVAGGAGVFFGLYPARQAARLDPVTALHGA